MNLSMRLQPRIGSVWCLLGVLVHLAVTGEVHVCQSVVVQYLEHSPTVKHFYMKGAD